MPPLRTLRRWTIDEIAALPLPAYRTFMRMLKRARRGDRPTKRRGRTIRWSSEDRAWSLTVRDRDGWRCRKCGRAYRRSANGVRSGLDAAHIMSRRFHATRWLPENGVSLCMGCHLGFHERPAAFERFCRDIIGSAEYDRLYALAHTPRR